MDLNIVPCIRAHEHLFNAHKICQWCNVPKDEIELKASRLRIKQLEEAIAKHKKFVMANYDEPDCSIVENVELWKQLN
jgi:hypothetical protein